MKKYFFPVFGVFTIFMLFGFVDSYRSVLLPEIKNEFQLDYKISSLIFFLTGLGYIIGNILGGEVSSKLKKKAVILIGNFLILFPVISILFIKSYAVFLGSMFLIGLGQGIMNTVSNVVITGLNIKNKGMALSILHGFYGIGALLTPVILSRLLVAGIEWRRTFLLLVFVYISLMLYFIIIALPEKELESESGKIVFKNIKFETGSVLFFLSVFFYMGSEVGLAAWLITYLQNHFNLSIQMSSFSLTLFYIFLTSGRLLGSLFVDKFEYLKTSVVLLLIVFFILVLGFNSGKKFTYLILPVSGLFYGNVFPNLTISLKKFIPNSQRIIGIFLASASLGAMVFVFFIGWLMDNIGIHNGMLSTIFFTILTIIVIIMIHFKVNHSKLKEEVL